MIEGVLHPTECKEEMNWVFHSNNINGSNKFPLAYLDFLHWQPGFKLDCRCLRDPLRSEEANMNIPPVPNPIEWLQKKSQGEIIVFNTLLSAVPILYTLHMSDSVLTNSLHIFIIHHDEYGANQDGLEFIQHRTGISGLTLAILSQILRPVEGFICVAQQQFQSWNNVLSPRQLRYLPAALPLLQPPLSHQGRLHDDNHTSHVTLLTLATFCPRKNQLDCIRTLGLCSIPLNVLLVGFDSQHPDPRYIQYGEKVKEMCKSHTNTKHTFQSFDITHKTEMFWEQADFYLCFSTDETGPLAVLEAMQKGIPVITRRMGIGIAQEIIQDNKTGFLFDHDHEVPDLIARIGLDKQLRIQVTRAAQIYIQENVLVTCRGRIDLFRDVFFPTSLTVWIDLDGVIVDWDHSFHLYFPTIIHDVYDIFQCSIPSSVTPQSLKDIVWSGDFYEHCQPIPGALSAIRDGLCRIPFVKIKFCTHIETANAVAIKAAKIRWICKYLGCEFVDRTVFLQDNENDRTLFQGDFLIDDNWNVNPLGKSTSWKLILFTQPYNLKHQHLSSLPNFSWSQLPLLQDYLLSEYTVRKNQNVYTT